VPPNGGSVPPSSPGGKPGEGREVIFEFIPLGGSVKVTAIDTKTGIEVSVVGPAGPAVHHELERIAVQKLKLRIAREAGDDSAAHERKPDPDKGGAGGGIIV